VEIYSVSEKAMTLDIPKGHWVKTGPEEDPSSRLMTGVRIFKILHYLEAYAVVEEGEQKAANETFESNVEGAYQAGEPDKAYQTVTIGDREYILVMTPSC
jgi:hypothetical protein